MAAPPAIREITERAFQGAVLDLARRTGWHTAHFNDSRRQIRPGVHVGDRDAAGLPDLILCRPPRLIFGELKRQKGRLTDAQQHWIDQLAGCYSIEVYVWRPDDWPEIERLLSPRNPQHQEAA